MARKIAIAELSAEERIELNFKNIEAKYNAKWDEVLAMKDNDPELQSALKELDKLRHQMFHAFDGWQHSIKHKFTAPTAEVKQLMYDAIMANFDCLPDAEEKEKLEKRWHTLEVVDDLISALKEWGVQVRAAEIETPPFCESCAAELEI